MIRLLIVAITAIATPLHAQSIGMAPPTVDLSRYATSTAVQDAKNAADAAASAAVTAKAAADAAAAKAAAAQAAVPDLAPYAKVSDVAIVQSTLMAAMPQRAITPPPSEQIAPTVGTSMRYRGADDPTPRIGRSVSGTTNAAGTGTVTWPAMPTIPKLDVTPYVAANATQVPACYPVTGTVTTTGATIACYMTQTLIGLGLLPFAKATGAVSFDVLVFPPS